MLSGKILLRASRNASAFLPRCEYHVYNIMNSLLLSSFYQFSQYLSPVDAVKLLYQERLGVPAATCAARQECEALKKSDRSRIFRQLKLHLFRYARAQNVRWTFTLRRPRQSGELRVIQAEPHTQKAQGA